MRSYDVVVVGAGNAAFCAAHAARERVGWVMVLEKAPREWAGGNTYFTAGASRDGIEVRYERAVIGLLRDDSGAVVGVVCDGPDGREEIEAGAVVLAGGGFESDARMRAEHLGPRWEAAKARGTPYNTGEVLHMALEAGAQPYGDWGGCHAIAGGAAAPPAGDRELTNLFSKQSYPLGIVVNREGRRFVDEGADYRNYTYAKYGAEILKQPGGVAFQIFDAKTEPLLR